mgnify:CR=1 FL=1
MLPQAKPEVVEPEMPKPEVPEPEIGLEAGPEIGLEVMGSSRVPAVVVGGLGDVELDC